jgi:hypothetical protein
MTRGLATVLFALLASVSAVVASEPTEQAEPRWTTSIGSLTIGSGEQTATFGDVRSSCNAFRLALAFGTAAADVRQCLPGSDSRRVQLEVEAGQVISASVDPDDDAGRCVVQALRDAQLQGLTCALQASVSR